MLIRILKGLLRGRAREAGPPAGPTANKRGQAADAALVDLARAVGCGPLAVEAGLIGLLDWICRSPLAVLQPHLPAIGRLGRQLGRSGEMQRHGEAVLSKLASFDPASLPPGKDEDAVYVLLRAADCSAAAPEAWMESLLQRAILPWMHRALAGDRHGLLLLLEAQAYAAYVTAREGEAHFTRAFGLWTPLMLAAGKRAGASLPPPDSRAPGAALRIAFVLQSGGFLAHTRILVNYLEILQARGPGEIEPLVLHRGVLDPALRDTLVSLGVSVACLDEQAPDGQGEFYGSLLALRRHVHAECIDAVVWVSTPTQMAFAFAMRVAPVQIWWSMKYHTLAFEGIDGYLSSQPGSGDTREMGGRRWRVVPIAGDGWHRPELAPQAARIRDSYVQSLLLGCFGREAKLASAPFLDSVIEILRARPEAGFLWTGRERSSFIESRFAAAGVVERCHYIGWVDTRLYAQVIDLFLDSFPFPCGTTLCEAMAAGRAAVGFRSPEAAERGLYGMAGLAIEGLAGSPQEQVRAREIFGTGDASLLYCAKDEAQYVDYALRLAGDPALRAAAGEANRRFIDEFMSDRARMEEQATRHLVEMVRQAGAGGA